MGIQLESPRHIPKPRFNWPIWVLVVALLVSGVGLTSLANGEASVVTAFFVAILFCQSSLLGLWAAFSNSYFVVRLAILFAALALLVAEISWATGLDGQSVLLVTVPTLLVGGVAWLVRVFRASIVRSDNPASTPKEQLQFSIRDLLWLTFVVACLLSVGRLIWPHFQVVGLIIIIPVLGICFATVGMASTWSILGSGNMLLRSVVVLVIAGVSGGIIGSLVPVFIIFWTAATLLHALFLLGSLLVVRRCGYRLVRRVAAG